MAKKVAKEKERLLEKNKEKPIARSPKRRRKEKGKEKVVEEVPRRQAKEGKSHSVIFNWKWVLPRNY